MQKRMAALFLVTAFIFSLLPLSAYAKSKSELQGLYDSVANHIFKNEELISSLITDEEDALCARAVIIARDLLLSDRDVSGEETHHAYHALFSAYSMLTLIEQRGSELTSDAKLNLFVTLSKIILTDDYYTLVDPVSAESIKSESMDIMHFIDNRDTMQPVGFSAAIQRFYDLLYQAANLKLQTYSNFFITAGFYDVSPNDWFRGAVEYVFENGLFKGTSATQFSPQLTMTRGMFITVLSRLAYADTSGYEAFYSDVDSALYYAAPIYWAKANKILTWAETENFFPDEPITREEMVMSMYNLSVFQGADVTNYDSEPSQGITDMHEADENAVEPIRWAYANGVISGYGDGSVKPFGTATRAEVAQVFVNFSQIAQF